MVNFTSFALFSLATLGMAAAQAPASSVSSSAAPSASSSASAAPSSSSSSSGGSQATPAPAGGICTALVGGTGFGTNPNTNDPRVAVPCTGTSTTVPPYDESSIASFLIGSYKPGLEATPIQDVASDLAKVVTSYYPTVSGGNIDAIASALSLAITQSAAAGVQPDASIADSIPSFKAIGLALGAVVAGAMLL